MAAAMRLGGFRIDDLLEAREKKLQDEEIEKVDVKVEDEETVEVKDEENEDEEEEEEEGNEEDEAEESESEASEQPMSLAAEQEDKHELDSPPRTLPQMPFPADNPLAAQNFLRIFNKMLANRNPVSPPSVPMQIPPSVPRANFISEYFNAMQFMQQKAFLASQQWPFNLGPRPPILPSPVTASFRPRFPTVHPTDASLFRPTISSGRLPRDSTPNKSNVKKYRCDICEKTFSRSNTLITHKRIHTGEKPFSCEHCGRAFRQPGNLTRHRLTHTTVKPFVCNECGKAFNRASNLHTHMKTHLTSSRMMSCFRCNKIFSLKSDYRNHQCSGGDMSSE